MEENRQQRGPEDAGTTLFVTNLLPFPVRRGCLVLPSKVNNNLPHGLLHISTHTHTYTQRNHQIGKLPRAERKALTKK
jgi:hypothetical protein